MRTIGGLFARFVIVLLLATFLVGCGGKRTKRIIFLNNTESPFWDACRSGLNQGETDFDLAGSGLTVSWQSNNGTPEGQIEKLRQFGTQSDVAAVAISVVRADNAGIMSEMKKLQAKGIKVITVDGDVNRDKYRDARAYYIGTDNHVGGNVLGQCAKTLLESKKVTQGGYAQFAGYTDNDNARSRMDGVKEALGDNYKELARVADDTDKIKARENVRNALANFKDELVCLMGIWSYNAPAIADVVKEKGVHDKVAVATFDAEEVAIRQMDEGQIDVMVVQDPFAMGRQTARLLKAMVTEDEATVKEMFPNAGKENGDMFRTGLRVVVPDEKSPIKADQFDAKVVEFMTLSQFKDWLKKYNLKSS